jgi:hypothetical protein
MGPDSPGGRTWLQRLPLPIFFFVAMGIWVAGQLIVAGRIDPIRITVDAIGGLVFASIFTGSLAVRRRRLGGADEYLQYARAMRSGTVPGGVDTSRWPAALDASERRIRRYRWLIPLLALLPIALGVWGLTDPESRVIGGLLIVLMIAAVIVAEAFVPRDLAKVSRIRDEIGKPQ